MEGIINYTKSVIIEAETLVKQKEDGNAVDLAEYQQTLQKIDIILFESVHTAIFNNLPEEIVIRVLQLYNRARQLSWKKLTSKLRGLAVLAGRDQRHELIEQIIEALLNDRVLNEELMFKILITAPNFDIVKWIKTEGNLTRLVNYLKQFKITGIALEILHFVMTRPGLIEVIGSEFTVPILEMYFRLTKHKEPRFTLSIWRSFNQPPYPYFQQIKQLDTDVKLEWITFLVQHYDVQTFEENYLELFKALASSVDVSLLPRAFMPGCSLNEHFFIKIMRDKQKKTFDFLMQIGYNFATFKMTEGRALLTAIQLRNSHFVKEILKRKLLNLDKIELSRDLSLMDLVHMQDLHIYQLIHNSGVDFHKKALIPSYFHCKVNYPFVNALMDWHLSKRQTKVLSLKRLCIIEVKANNISDERLPHDLRDAIDEYKEPWYWLNWNDDEDEKNYWKEWLQYLRETARTVEKNIADYTLKTIHDDYLTLRMDVTRQGSFPDPWITFPEGYRNLPKKLDRNNAKPLAECLGFSLQSISVFCCLVALVTIKVSSPDQFVPPDQHFSTIYKVSPAALDTHKPNWYARFLRAMTSEKL